MVNDRYASGTYVPTAPAAEAAYGYYAPQQQDDAGTATWNAGYDYAGYADPYGNYICYDTTGTAGYYPGDGDISGYRREQQAPASDDPLFGPLPNSDGYGAGQDANYYPEYSNNGYDPTNGYGTGYQLHSAPTIGMGLATPVSDTLLDVTAGGMGGYPEQFGEFAAPEATAPAGTGTPQASQPAEPAGSTEPPAAAPVAESTRFPDPRDAYDDDPLPEPARNGAVAANRPPNRRRRSSTAKRSALLTVAVPSVAVMGMAAVAAAATVTAPPDAGDAIQADATTNSSIANTKLDQQLAGLSEDADDFADRASRTQERIDLKQRQAEEKKLKEEEAARKEAMRPKFALPVTEHGLSAYFGQAGVHWMALHTGIDFPVSYGTPVMAATDGTVRTQWNSAYGNMVILTAPDGTETWYCHLSSAKIRSGSVKAGDVIAYSGNSGNSTGPHLHFEVRPGAGSAIDPLP